MPCIGPVFVMIFHLNEIPQWRADPNALMSLDNESIGENLHHACRNREVQPSEPKTDCTVLLLIVATTLDRDGIKVKSREATVR